MRRHVEDGAEMVAALGDRDLAGVVRHHHERFDGTGYPAGLKGDAIPLGSRIIAVPDTFDAIITTRPYRSGVPHKDALDVLRDEAGRQFDPAVVRAFLAEYTDRRGAMIWAAAEQLVPILRVAAVAVAATVLSAMAFAAGAPGGHTRPPARAAAAVNSGRTPSGARPSQPRVSPREQSRPNNARRHESRVRKPGHTQQPAPGPSSATPAPAPAQAPRTVAPSTPASLPPSQVPRTRAPPPSPPASSPRRGPFALTPQAATAYSQLGSSFTNSGDLGAVTAPPQAQPSPAPTTTTTPTAPAAPPTTPSPTAPAPPTGRTTPMPPSNTDQCKDGGWQTLGYENQGQCIAAANKG